MAIQHIERTSETKLDTIILSDSQSSLEYLKSFKVGDNPPFLVQQILSAIASLKQRDVKIAMQWIPSHINIAPADHADIIAKTYAEHGAQNLHSNTSFSDLVILMKNVRNISWRTEHHRMLIGRGAWTDHIISDPLQKPWYRGTTGSPQFYTTANRILFGHGNTPLFQHLMKHKDDPFCTQCPGEVGDMNHALNHCARTRTALEDFKNNKNINSNTLQEHIKLNLSVETLEQIFQYITENNISV